MVKYPRLNSVDTYTEVEICPKCGHFVHWHTTKQNKQMLVSLTDGLQFIRYGNNNNHIQGHICNTRLCTDDHFFDVASIPDVVKSKYKSCLMQMAITTVLDNYNKPRIRSTFKKSIYAQTIAHMDRAENQYAYPFSRKCACMILGITG